MMKKVIWLILVLIVGVLLGVSITANAKKNEDNTRENLIGEIIQMGGQAMAWYRTPAMYGGGGYAEELPVETVYMIAEFIEPSSQYGVIETTHGIYTLSLDDWELSIEGRGKGRKVIQSRGTVMLNAGEDSGVTILPVSEVYK